MELNDLENTKAQAIYDKENAELTKRTRQVENLLNKFGIQLNGYLPGVTGYYKIPINKGTKDISILLDCATWYWLEPLLKELQKLREKEYQNDN